MSDLTLISDFSLDTTSLSNIYIDEYMSANNESQIKIYLYLLRNLSSGTPVSAITIADTFNYSVTDVERALIYMEKQGLMSLRMENNAITGLRLLPLRKKRTDSADRSENFKLMEVPVNEKVSEEAIASKEADAREASSAKARKANMAELPVKPEYTKDEIREFKADSEIDELLFVIQAYTGKPVVANDIRTLKYIHDGLGFNAELIDFLAEYCVGRGKKTFGYMEKVAVDWFSNGVKSVEDAKNAAFDVPEDVYRVFKAYGIKGGNRKPSMAESSFVKKWTGNYAFTMDIIEYACQITIDRIHSVSFEYTDAILADWNKKGVKHLSDAMALLNSNNGNKSGTGSNAGAGSTASSNSGNRGTRKKQGAGSFNNFSSRDYDFAQLEKELLQN